jgi:hypothetical protein
MSFQFHPGAYESVSLKHQDLIAEAEQMRQLTALRTSVKATARTRAAVGRWLIAIGERIAQPAQAAGRI